MAVWNVHIAPALYSCDRDGAHPSMWCDRVERQQQSRLFASYIEIYRHSLVFKLQNWQRLLVLVWLWLNYLIKHFFLHFYHKLCWFTWQGRRTSINLLICHNRFTAPAPHESRLQTFFFLRLHGLWGFIPGDTQKGFSRTQMRSHTEE